MRPLNLPTFVLTLSIFQLTSCQDSDPDTSIDPTPEISGYSIVGTGQRLFYNVEGTISKPAEGDRFYGQDANDASYRDNDEGTITDLVTGLMWQKELQTMRWEEAEGKGQIATTGGYTDWRVPTIKELYSLVDFTGNQGTGDPASSTPPIDAKPFINSDYFDFEYGSNGRYIDVQLITKTSYLGEAINNSQTFFGLNPADGRIKAYPKEGNLSNPEYTVRFVRGNDTYGINQFRDNGDGTITDSATGLMWAKGDSGNPSFATELEGYTFTNGSLNWEEALSFTEKSSFAGYTNWRLPDAKELQSILDYTRCPDVTNSAAIDPIFEITAITNEAGQIDYPSFWTSTSFNPGFDAVIICFGRAMGYLDPLDPLFNSNPNFLDVHGAGCQRTDQKEGIPSYGFGPQGEVRRIYNYVRMVRTP